MRADRTFTALLTVSLLALALPVVLAARLLPLALPAALGGMARHGSGLLGAACARLFGLLPGGPSTVVILTGGLLATSITCTLWSAAGQWRRGMRLAAAVRTVRRPLARPLGRHLRRAGLGAATGRVDVVEAVRPAAFTYGWRSPRICVTSGLLDLLQPDELHAVLRHELHHVLRRDPLRLFLARTFAGGAFFVPALRDMQVHSLTLLELAADDAAAAAPAGRGALARALYALVRYWRGAAAGEPVSMGSAAGGHTGLPLWTLAEGAVTFGPQPREVLNARIDHLVNPQRRPAVVWSPARLAATGGVLGLILCLLLLL